MLNFRSWLRSSSNSFEVGDSVVRSSDSKDVKSGEVEREFSDFDVQAEQRRHGVDENFG